MFAPVNSFHFPVLGLSTSGIVIPLFGAVLPTKQMQEKDKNHWYKPVQVTNDRLSLYMYQFLPAQQFLSYQGM